VVDTIFFDLDGTLCYSEAEFSRVFYMCCGKLIEDNLYVQSEDLLSAWMQVPTDHGALTTQGRLERAVHAVGLAIETTELEKVARNINTTWAAVQHLRRGARCVLNVLSDSHPLGIITNGTSDGQRAVIRKLRIDRYFRWIIVSGDGDIGHWKPNPGIFEYALEISGSLPHETWYVGDDQEKDIYGASKLGIRTVLFNARHAPDWEIIAEPDLSIVDLRQLLDSDTFGDHSPRSWSKAT